MKTKIMQLVIFSIAMAALESAVVVYLRVLYYADGFTIAFKLIDPHILLIEIVREIATLVMLLSVACLSAQERRHRFPYFLVCFAVWDIFYYAWLKIFIDWPASFFDWDILFLLPITWLGPVLSPIICSLTMLLLATVCLQRTHPIKSTILSKTLLGIGSVLILFTYLKDYGNLLLKNELLFDYLHLLENEKFILASSSYLPENYNWPIFWLGEFVIGCAIVQLYFISKGKFSNGSLQ